MTALSESNGDPAGIPADLLKSIDKKHVGAAVSKLVSASIGDICVVMSRSPAYKHYSLADIEWMVLPAVLSGQFYVADAEHKEDGFRAPIAALTWARVSEETDRRLSENVVRPIRLRPDEWTGGDIWWLVDAVGDYRAVAAALRSVAEATLRDREVKVVIRDAAGVPRLGALQAILADAKAGQP